MAAELPAVVESVEDALVPEAPEAVLVAAEAKPETVRSAKAQQAKQRRKAMAILVLRQQGHGRDRIAKMLGMTPKAVRAALYRARKKGLLDDLDGALQHDSLALAIEGLNHHLEKRDKDAIFETLRGLGAFRNYSHQKHDGSHAQMPPLTVNIIQAPASETRVVVSEPMGAPRED